MIKNEAIESYEGYFNVACYYIGKDDYINAKLMLIKSYSII